MIIPKRHFSDYFDLINEELVICNDLVKIIKKDILDKDNTVKGFNIETYTGNLRLIYYALSYSSYTKKTR